MQQGEWSVAFYTREDGKSPVEEFLDGLDRQAQSRFVWSIEQLRQRNIRASEPLVRHIEGRVWKLRRESRTNIYRLFYVFLEGRRILFLHGFQKKTEKTPRGEIDIALSRLQDFVTRPGGET